MAGLEVDCTSLESEEEEEGLDPRVKEELECLNNAADEINKLETEIENTRAKFRSLLTDSTCMLNLLFKKIGKCINKVRPYYELLKDARKAQAEAQRAVVNYQRSIGIYRAAMETVQLAETRAVDGQIPDHKEFDQAWQEVLNHATQRFMESEVEKRKSEEEHMKRAAQMATIRQQLKDMEKKWNRTIPKSRPYFEMKEKFELQLEQQKLNVEDLQRALNQAKQKYKNSLEALESISNSVHEKRRQKIQLPPRTPGVGAESNSSSIDLPAINLEIRSECSDEAFEDFDDSESINSDTASICSEGSSPKPEAFKKGHRRNKSCDSKALMGTSFRTVSVDEGYSTSKSDSSSFSQSPEIIFDPTAKGVNCSSVLVPPVNLTSSRVREPSEASQPVHKQTEIVTASTLEKHPDQSLATTVTKPKASSVTNLTKEPVSSLNQNASKVSLKDNKSHQANVMNVDISNSIARDSISPKKVVSKNRRSQPTKLTTSGALPLLVDLASINKDVARTYTF